MPAAPTPEDRLVAAAAAVMGRRGGLSKSARKIKAVRENGKKGGRPLGALGSKPLVMTKMAIYQRRHRARVKAAKAKNQAQ